jgi:YD repeat-containing protein
MPDAPCHHSMNFQTCGSAPGQEYFRQIPSIPSQKSPAGHRQLSSFKDVEFVVKAKARLASDDLEKFQSPGLLSRLVICLFLAFAFVHLPTAHAQALSPASQTGDPINTSSIIHGADSVNTMGLGLKIEIPLLTLQERGRTYTWKYVFNSPSWELKFLPTPEPQNREAGSWVVVEPGGNPLLRSPGSDNWLFVTPTSWYFAYDPQIYDSSGNLLECSWKDEVGNPEQTQYEIYANFRLVDPEGTQHPVAMSEVQYFGTTGAACGPTNNVISPTVDGSGAYVDQTQSAFWLKDGTKYPLTPFNGSYSPPSVIESGVEDANGNLLYGDMMKRSGLTAVSSTSAQTVYQYTDSNGTPQNITVNFESVPYQTDDCSLLGANQGSNPCTERSGTFSFPESIILPNGQSYQFTYNQNGRGELTGMTLPTGASITYAYNTAPLASGTVSIRGGTMSYRYPLSTRTEALQGQTNVWNYSSQAVSQGAQRTIEDPTGNCKEYLYQTLGSSYPVLALTTYLNGCGTSAPVLKTIGNTYAYDTAAMPGLSYGVYNARPTNVITTLNGTLSSQVQTDFETFTFGSGLPGTRMNPTEQREYDYGASTATRTTDYTYLHNTGSSTRAASAYQAQHIVDKVKSKIIAGTAGQLRSTTYDYDNYGTGITASGVVQHDTARGNWGNVTSQVVKDIATSTSYTSTYSYEDTGNVIQATDPLSYKTNYSYSDNWNDSTCAVPSSGQGHIYPTKLTNALGQSVTYSFNSCTGTLASIHDLNSNATTMSWDELARTLSITYPDSGISSYSYNDSSFPLSVTSYHSLSSGGFGSGVSTQSTAIYDGLGRKTTTQTLVGKSGFGSTTSYSYNFVDNVYDGVGQVASKSNPYSSTSDSSYGLTKISYDGLGRPILQTNPDSSTHKWTYLTNTVTETDENSDQWTLTSNVFGGITTLLEPNGSSTAPSMETDYTYDTFNNLLSVKQIGNTAVDTARVLRMFNYDNFSRLTSSFNLESGSATYVYDGDNNLKSKVEAAVNSTNGTRTTYYCYDTLNRLTLRYVYSGAIGCPTSSSPTTPSSLDKDWFSYDGTLLPGSLATGITFSNAQGRRSDAQHLLSNSLISESVSYNYDQLGRNKTDLLIPFAPTGAKYTSSHTYDLGGNALTSSNSASGIVFSDSYDTAARLTGVASSVAVSGIAQLYTVNKYGPVGLVQATYAADPNNVAAGTGFFNLFRYYNSRGWLADSELYPLTSAFGTGSVLITGGTATDSGTLKITAGSVTASANYVVGDDEFAVAEALAGSFNQNGASPVTASVQRGAMVARSNSGSLSCQTNSTPSPLQPACAIITLKAIVIGQYGDVALSIPAGSGISFTETPSNSTLIGGVGSPQGSGYAYVNSLAYDHKGNISSTADAYNGGWAYTYDTLSRLTSARFTNYEGTGVVTPGGTYNYQCWAYDGFGNRTYELESNAVCPTSWSPGVSTHYARYGPTTERPTRHKQFAEIQNCYGWPEAGPVGN